MRHAAVAALLVAASACKSGDDPACRAEGTNVVRRPFATVSDLPVMAASPPGDPRLFVAERGGVIEIVEAGKVAPAPFLDVSDAVAIAGDEQGLLGLAFHPEYAANRRFYVYYTTNTDDVIAEYTTRSDDPNRADPASARVLLAIPDFAANHNGGMLEFGADGLLYASTGDGGGGGDPTEAAQDRTKVLGKIRRHRPASEGIRLPVRRHLHPRGPGRRALPRLLRQHRLPPRGRVTHSDGVPASIQARTSSRSFSGSG